VSLPYAESVSKTALPVYYDYAGFTGKIEADLIKAESLLKNNDPIFKNTFAQLNSAGTVSDEFLLYRQYRFNYWAVKALQARFYLYTGNTSKAYTIAKEIINTKGADGNPLITLSTATDFASGYMASPTESLMMLNVYNLVSYSPGVIGEGNTQIRTTNRALSTVTILGQLFTGQNTTQDIRYQLLWDQTSKDPSGVIRPALKKYFYSTTSYNTLKQPVIPLFRLSEIYLIAMETTSDLNEANTMWIDYQKSKSVLLTVSAFASLSAVKTALIDEYRRELFGEGQMFYTYKRQGTTLMKFRTAVVTETNYIVPLPDSEFNPNI
jgi:hypothetical protein